LSSAVVKLPPLAIRRKISVDLLADALDHRAWTSAERTPLDQTAKYRSIVQHYAQDVPWEDTPLFADIYRRRFETERSVRGCRTIEELLAQYETRVDALFADLQANGYQRLVNGGPTPNITVYLTHDDEYVLGNQGNHRLAMAQILGLDFVVCEVVARHPDSRRALSSLEPLGPALPECAIAIPAMTTEAERLCYYRHTKEQASRGAVVELGAWLGAATAYIAAGLRDAKATSKAHIYDRFVWKPASHDKKAGGRIKTSQLEALYDNLGPLLEHVEVHPAELRNLSWKGGNVSLLICDAPKRIAEISAVLQTFGKAMQPGALMAWQDFAYFPSYDIPAAVIRLGDRLEFVEAVYPGTTAVFRVRSQWSAKEVSKDALAIRRWRPEEVEAAWDAWGARLPEPMRPRFACGAAMFLCDLGAVDRAQRRLQAVIAAHREAVLPKWRYLVEERAALMQRYQPLVELVACA
jgi:hypothetical protein